MRNQSRRKPDDGGFTLLEVILSLAILAGSVAVLGEIMGIAGRHGRDAEAEVRAQLIASSIMDEMLSQVVEPAQVSRQAVDTTDTVPWVYSVNIQNTTVTGLSSIEVIVEQDLESEFNPLKYTLHRWYAVPTSTTTPTDADTGTGGSGV
jgi:prepilin-type N-terminal cleavage/methylation domain-containing protein